VGEMKISNYFKKISKSSNQQLGHVCGTILGLIMGAYTLSYTKLVSLPIIGILDHFPIIIVQIIIIPALAGALSNIFGNLGAGIDVLTEKKTLFNLVWYLRQGYSKTDNTPSIKEES
jgi:hypothetical protein